MCAGYATVIIGSTLGHCSNSSIPSKYSGTSIIVSLYIIMWQPPLYKYNLWVPVYIRAGH